MDEDQAAVLACRRKGEAGPTPGALSASPGKRPAQGSNLACFARNMGEGLNEQREEGCLTRSTQLFSSRCVLIRMRCRCKRELEEESLPWTKEHL